MPARPLPLPGTTPITSTTTIDPETGQQVIVITAHVSQSKYGAHAPALYDGWASHGGGAATSAQDQSWATMSPTDRAQKNGINAHMKVEGLAPMGDEFEVAGEWGDDPLGIEATRNALQITAILTKLSASIAVSQTSATLWREIQGLPQLNMLERTGTKARQHYGELGFHMMNRDTAQAYRQMAQMIRSYPEQVRYGHFDGWGPSYFFERDGIVVTMSTSGAFITMHPTDPPQPNSAWSRATPLPGSRP